MVKVNIHTIQAVNSAGVTNLFRYYLAARLMDAENDHVGRVDTTQYIARVTACFGVTPKTVTNTIIKLREKGWLTGKTDDVFYLKSIDKLLPIINLSSNAVEIDWADLAKLATTRAKFYAILLTTRKGETTIARDTIHGFTRRSVPTQHKYEKAAGIEKRFNHAVVRKFDSAIDLRYVQETECVAAYVGTVDQQSYVMRQIPNTYNTGIKLCKRRGRYPQQTHGSGNDYTKVFYKDGEKVKDNNRRVYVQFTNHARLWVAYGTVTAGDTIG